MIEHIDHVDRLDTNNCFGVGLLDEDLCGSLGRLAGWTQYWFGRASAMLGEHRQALEYFPSSGCDGAFLSCMAMWIP